MPHRGDGALFHYTSLKSFKTILKDMTLLPSSFEKLNDMNEGNVHNMCLNHNFMVMNETDKFIKERCHILCFSQNYEIHGYPVEGTNHPAMWAHYADNSNGVCIVIDKEAFLEKNKDVLSAYFHMFEDVEYAPFNTPDYKEINYEASSPEEFIKNNCKAFFFLKHKDWESEDEHRLFIMDYDGKLSIDGCIKFVVLGRKIFLDNSKIKEIMDMVVNPDHACYHKFVPHSFATTCYNTSGYDTFEIAFKICECVRVNISNPLYSDYEKWLKEEHGYSF